MFFEHMFLKEIVLATLTTSNTEALSDAVIGGPLYSWKGQTSDAKRLLVVLK